MSGLSNSLPADRSVVLDKKNDQSKSVEPPRDVLEEFLKDPEEARRMIEEEGAPAHADEQVKWRKAYQRSISHTTRYLFSFFSLQVGITVLFALWKSRPEEPGLWLLMFWLLVCLTIFVVKWVRELIFYFAFWKRLKRSDPDYTTWLESRRKFGGSIYLNIFSLRHIWLWTLMAGTAGASIGFVKNGGADSMAYAQDLIRALIIALVAYIATNVVKEMLQMRVRYQESIDRITTINDALKGVTTDVENVEKRHDSQLAKLAEIEAGIDVAAAKIVASSELDKTKKLLNEMRSKNAEIAPLIAKTFENLTEETEKIAERIGSIEQTDRASEMLIKQLYLEVLNQYVVSEIAGFQTSPRSADQASKSSDGIVTRFSVVGQMVRKLLGEKALPVTYHALLVIPPARFLNYRVPVGADGRKATRWASFRGGDDGWEQYLAANLEAAGVSGRVYRQFLAITDGEEENGGGLSPEAEALRAVQIREQLSLKVLCDPQGVPIKKNKDTADWQYDIRSREESSANAFTLAKVIGDKFHAHGCCFVREVSEANFNKKDGLGRLLKDEITQKPLDYFAARCGRRNQWVFCLRLRYDEDFDVAILDLLYPGSVPADKWAKITKDLDLLFASANRGSEITEYEAAWRPGSNPPIPPAQALA